MKCEKSRTIDLKAEDRARTFTSTRRGCPIERVAEHNQTGVRRTAVAAACESVKYCKTIAVGTNLKQCAVPGAAIGGGAIQHIARQYQRAARPRTIGGVIKCMY